MKLPYKEGDIFAVPLKTGGFGLGVVARCPAQGKVLLGYFFAGPKTEPPKVGGVPNLRADDAVLIARFGDLSLYRRDWPVVGHISDWDRRDWPMPSFALQDPLSSKRAWKITYSEDDPAQEVNREPAGPDSHLQPAALYGAGAVEIALSELVGKG